MQAKNNRDRNITVHFYIENKAINVVENAGALGLPIPQKLLDVLAQLRDKSNDDNN